MSKLLFVCAFAAVISASLALTCSDPTVESISFTTQDATIVSQIGFISEFSLKCSNKASESNLLFAEFDGKLSPVARIGSERFQVRKDSSENFVSNQKYAVDVTNQYFIILSPRSAGRKRRRKPAVAITAFVCSMKKVSPHCAKHNVPEPMHNRSLLWPKWLYHIQEHSTVHGLIRKFWQPVYRFWLLMLHSQPKVNCCHRASKHRTHH